MSLWGFQVTESALQESNHSVKWTFNYELQTINTKLPQCGTNPNPLKIQPPAVRQDVRKKVRGRDAEGPGKCHKLWQFQAAAL